MPILRISAEQAVATRKANPYSNWGDRASENRVEPIAKPAFKVPFRIQPKSKIFTVGSCFARNVEDELIRQGFDLPMRKIEVEDTSVLNNYGAPSIYNEFAWAFGDKPFVAEDHIVEVAPGKFADLHLPPNRRPQPYDEVLARRMAIIDAYRQAAECSVVVMTLGLVELWFDTKTGYYLNVGPRPSQIRAEPERFEMHVLSFDECHDFLERAMQLLRKHGRPELQVLLTVSPVPLSQTHRDEDVIVANMYSKSLLRVVAETIVAKHDFVTYYPSYESVMYSDRQRAWMDDMVHVRDEIVALNVGRMVDAYVQPEKSLETLRAEIEGGGMAVAVENARKFRMEGKSLAGPFFREFGGLSRQSAEFALEYALYCDKTGDHAKVLEVLDAAPPGLGKIKIVPLKAGAMVRLGRAKEAMGLFDAFLGVNVDETARMKSPGFWQSLLDTALATEDEAVVVSTLHKVTQAHVNYRPWAYTVVGSWFLSRSKLEQAVRFLEMATNTDAGAQGAILPLAEAYSALGKKKKALAMLDRLAGTGLEDSVKAGRLRRMLA
jgi:hypothetical protein